MDLQHHFLIKGRVIKCLIEWSVSLRLSLVYGVVLWYKPQQLSLFSTHGTKQYGLLLVTIISGPQKAQILPSNNCQRNVGNQVILAVC